MAMHHLAPACLLLTVQWLQALADGGASTHAPTYVDIDDECSVAAADEIPSAACALHALQLRSNVSTASAGDSEGSGSDGLTAARGLFTMDGGSGPANPSVSFSCSEPGKGTKQAAKGPGGCLNVQPGIVGFEGASPQTVASFLVEPCGIVAPHTHANAAEVNTVVRGQGIIAQLTTESNKLQVSYVKEGDSFLFARGAYHWWMNLGTEQLVTVGAFLNTGDPNAALMAYDDGAGVVGALMEDQTLLHNLIGQSSGRKNTVPLDGGHPLFPQFTEQACEHARASFTNDGKQKMAATADSFQKNPAETRLYQPDELQSGKFSISSSSTPVHGPGGGLRPLAGVVSSADFTPGSDKTMPAYDGGMAPTASGGGPPPPALWPGLTNVAGGKTLVKFVVGYCGMVAIHTHVNAAEWNTVISGSGQVAYYQVNTGAKPQVVKMNVKVGDSFVFPRGTAHWWVNDSPTEQLATIGGFTAPFPDTSLFSEFFDQSNEMFPDLVSAVLGEGFHPSVATQGGDLFPLMPSRSPSNCGGDIPCHKC